MQVSPDKNIAKETERQKGKESRYGIFIEHKCPYKAVW